MGGEKPCSKTHSVTTKESEKAKCVAKSHILVVGSPKEESLYLGMSVFVLFLHESFGLIRSP